MSEPPLIYIAGPYRAPTTWEINVNIHSARLWGAVVAKHGAYPVIPHSNTAHMDGVADDKLWLAGTLALLRRCDAAVFIPGWKDSQGAIVEHQTAKDLCLPILDVSSWDFWSMAMTSMALKDWLSAIQSREK